MNSDKEAFSLDEENDLYEHHSFIADKGQQPLRIDKYLMNFIENATRNNINHAQRERQILYVIMLQLT